LPLFLRALLPILLPLFFSLQRLDISLSSAFVAKISILLLCLLHFVPATEIGRQPPARPSSVGTVLFTWIQDHQNGSPSPSCFCLFFFLPLITRNLTNCWLPVCFALGPSTPPERNSSFLFLFLLKWSPLPTPSALLISPHLRTWFSFAFFPLLQVVGLCSC